MSWLDPRDLYNIWPKNNIIIFGKEINTKFIHGKKKTKPNACKETKILTSSLNN